MFVFSEACVTLKERIFSPNAQERKNAMSQSVFTRMTVCLMFAAALLSILPGCTKRIDTSSNDKYYKSLTEVMVSLPASQHREFDDGISMIWFYSKSEEETNAMIHGKSGGEMMELIREMKASLPQIDTSSKEAYEDSLAKIRASLPDSRIKDYEKWVKELPPYRQGNPKTEALNGKIFHELVD